MSSQKKTTVIISSYRKFYDAVLSKIDEFERLGISVLSPPKSKIANPGEEFVRLVVDDGLSNKNIELSFLDAVRSADFVYVLNPSGYVGLSAAFEIGFAHAIGKEIVCMEEPTDPTIAMFCKKID